MVSHVTEQHQALIVVATQQNCPTSSLEEGGVSMHTLPETASFSNIDTLECAAKSPAYIGTSAGDLVFSAHLESAENELDEGDGGETEHRPKKRRRDNLSEVQSEDAQKIAAARARLEKSVPELHSEDLDVAQKVLTKLVDDLRGPTGEVVVQSTALLAKKLGSGESRQRVVVAARLNAGIAIRVDALRNCMGKCWADGLLTTLPTLHGIGSIELPLSEEARAATLFGNKTILLVSSVEAK